MARVGRQSLTLEQDFLVGLPLERQVTLIADGGPVAAYVEAQAADDAELEPPVEHHAPLVQIGEKLRGLDAELDFTPRLNGGEVRLQAVVVEQLRHLLEDRFFDVVVAKPHGAIIDVGLERLIDTDDVEVPRASVGTLKEVGRKFGKLLDVEIAEG